MMARKKTAARARTFGLRIPGVNISISLQPTKKGVLIVKPRVSRVTISRGGGVSENPRRRRNPLRVSTIPGQVGILRPGNTVRRFAR